LRLFAVVVALAVVVGGVVHFFVHRKKESKPIDQKTWLY
jgi:hypothetical protein